jgi:hypothetical protein
VAVQYLVEIYGFAIEILAQEFADLLFSAYETVSSMEANKSIKLHHKTVFA